MKAGSLNYDVLKDVVRQLPDNGLSAVREAALLHFGEHGLPTLRDEDWKYTDLAPLIDISNRWLGAGGQQRQVSAERESIEAITRSIDANWIVIANGHIDQQAFETVLSDAISVSRISDAPSQVTLSRPLSDLNAALLQDGLRIQVSACEDKPIGILIFDGPDADVGVTQNRIEIDVAPGGAADFIEYHVSRGDGDHYANSVLTMTIGDDATVNHVRIQDRALHHVQTSRTSVFPGRNAVLRMSGFDLGGRLVRNDVEIDLNSAGAEVTFDGLYLAGDGQHIDNHTRVDHRVGPATSSQEYRGILNGKCRCVWNGKAIVHKGADGTDAQQANHNLLMSEKAEIDAKPELEIYAEDVKCAHGTTVGQLDETALFYLRSRGLDKRHATQVLTHAFAADLVRRLPVKAAMDGISSIVEARLAELIEADDVAEMLA
ncbi:MAG: Fe-S cluster assembly protein SufD [Gammaproteobacteria bacterium]|nr:Fe-S cluster assembly protein SufD [Gammaproteobacteria bacterium]